MAGPKTTGFAGRLAKTALFIFGLLLCAFGLLVLACGLYGPGAGFVTPGAAICWFFRPRRKPKGETVALNAREATEGR